jgi:hypothetical protein
VPFVAREDRLGARRAQRLAVDSHLAQRPELERPAGPGFGEHDFQRRWSGRV